MLFVLAAAGTVAEPPPVPSLGGKIRECTKGKGMKNLRWTEELESAEATEGGVLLCYLVIAFLGGQRYSQWDREGIGPDISETCPHI